MSVIAALVCGSAVVGAGGAARSAPATDDGRAGPRPGFRLAEDRGRTVLRYRGALEGRTAPDSSGAGNAGRLLTGAGGGVLAARAGGDRYLRFTGDTCKRRSTCAWAVIAVRPSRDPEGGAQTGGTPSFTFGAWVRLTAAPGGSGMTVIRRGGTGRGDAHWSLDVDDGRVSCRWSDGADTTVLPDDLRKSVALRLGRWYALSCSRHGSRFSLAVTDVMSAWSHGTFRKDADDVGAATPQGPITVGAAAEGPVRSGSERITSPFHGDLDEVMVRTG